MDVQVESWRTLTTLSPFLLPLASAIVVLLIRDLLNPRQWQRYVRKIFFAALAGTLVFGCIVAGYLFLVQQVGSEDSPIVISATVVVALAIIPTTVFAIVMTFERVEPNADWYLNSRFRYSFQNGSWPVLSVDVPFECLPDGATSISGRIAAVRESVGQYRLRVTVGTGNETKVLLDQTTRNPRPGWMRLMRGGAPGPTRRPEADSGVAGARSLPWETEELVQESGPHSGYDPGSAVQMAGFCLPANSPTGAEDGGEWGIPLTGAVPSLSIQGMLPHAATGHPGLRAASWRHPAHNR